MDLSESNLNLVQIFLKRSRHYKDRPALYYKNPQKNYQSISWSEWEVNVSLVSSALDSFGVRYRDRVGIISENRPEWTMADLGVLSLGAILVPVYPTSSAADLSYYIENAGIEVFFVSTFEQLRRLESVLLENSAVRKIILFEACDFSHPKVVSFADFLSSGLQKQKTDPDFFQKSADKVSPSDEATIIYTSGTTGPPKGVLLTHRNFVENYLGARERIKVSDKDAALSFLPLNHVFERLAGYYFMAFHGASIWYAESMQTVAQDMMIARPTIGAAVPRFYEKVYAGIREKLGQASPLQKKIFNWAVKAGRKSYENRLTGKRGSLSQWVNKKIAGVLVFNKIRKKLGGRLRFFISGGAPLSKELAEFFYAAGILILEGYGLTETSPVIAVNTEKEFKFGTVGKPLPNLQVKIAGDGEILTAGPCVMSGYYKNEQATAEVIKDGWFHTGDIGEFDPEGYLKITDRKKDIIATSGGKKVAPQNLEILISGDSLFSQVVIIGDKRNYLTALIVPNKEEVLKKAAELNLSSAQWEDVLKNPEINAWAAQRLAEKTSHLAPYEQVKYFTFLPQELSAAAGELTPTMKVKRKVVSEKYSGLIEQMYKEGASAKK